MRRREFIAFLGGAATSPLAARAQQGLPVVGFLNSGAAAPMACRVAAFLKGLAETRHAEGRDVTIEYRWAEGNYDRLLAFATEFVRRPVNVIAAGGPPAAQAAKATTSTIPIVFTSGVDPVGAGLVTSFNRPSGNITGVHLQLAGVAEKKLGLLRLLLPQASVIAVLLNPTAPEAEPQSRSLQDAARNIGQTIKILHASNEREIANAFDDIVEQHAQALVVGADPLFFVDYPRLIQLAAQHSIPAIYDIREVVLAGGLMSYGTNLDDAYRQQGNYVGRILKGEKPGDLPVVQSSKFEFVINIKTAKALGIVISDNLMSLADEVIE